MDAQIDVPDIDAQSHDSIVRQIEQWLAWMDQILEFHRAFFLFRNAGAHSGLERHERAIKLALRYSHFANALVADPDFNEPTLVRRLRVRIQKLQDAYDTFHDPEVTEEKADRILAEVFPG